MSQDDGNGFNNMQANHAKINQTTDVSAIQNDDSIDEVSKATMIAKIKAQGPGIYDQEMADYRNGTGVYGINKTNSALLNAQKATPGRSQSILTSGASAITGTPVSGLLTDFGKTNGQ